MLQGLHPGLQIVTDLGPPEMVIKPVPGVQTGLPRITVSVWLITATGPIRSVLPGLAETEIVKEPPPVLLPPLVIVIHPSFGTDDERMEKIAKEVYPEVSLLKQVKGVGTQIALTYVPTIEDPYRFAKSREVGCFLGLRPGRRNSGQSEPQKKISKAGPVSENHDGARSALHSGAIWRRQ